MRLILAVLFNSVALYATALVVPGISFTGGWGALLVAGLIIGVFNYFVRPIAVVLSLPLLVVTLGLFYFVLNGLLLWAASLLVPGYRVDGLVSAILGGLVFALVNWALQALSSAADDRGKD